MADDPTAVRARRRGAIDVFRYLDYRRYLADYYRSKKSKGFSYRAFSRAAGLGAPNYLKLVIGGQRNLTAAMAERFARACGLSGEAAAYFTQLVAFNQARTREQRNQSYARLIAFGRYRRGHKLDLAQAAYHSTWYAPAIRELAASAQFREDPEWIAENLWPKIKASEAKQALETLLELGLLERDPHGRLRQTTPVVSTGPETLGMHITNYHAEMMRRATAAMELVPAASRDVSALTFCVGPNGLAKLKQRIQEIRRELIELVEAEPDRNQVVQLNLQLFPLTQAIGGAKRTAGKPTKEERDD
jgi:uncharacterized protein (TIGR02147 family)